MKNFSQWSAENNLSYGQLYIVATPIGNLDDITARAITILKEVNCIAAEDTRHSMPLLHHFKINTQLIAYHEHNEKIMTPLLIKRIMAGESVALISDAGTPLISDPGFELVRTAREANISVIPIPGANAIVCALSACGLPCDRFIFEGFLPTKEQARLHYLQSLCAESRTLIFYESPYRLSATLADLVATFGDERRAVIARELTKIHETFLMDSLGKLLTRVNADSDQSRGEIVIIVAGAPKNDDLTNNELQAHKIFAILKEELPASHAVALTARITGISKNILYNKFINQ